MAGHHGGKMEAEKRVVIIAHFYYGIVWCEILLQCEYIFMPFFFLLYAVDNSSEISALLSSDVNFGLPGFETILMHAFIVSQAPRPKLQQDASDGLRMKSKMTYFNLSLRPACHGSRSLTLPSAAEPWRAPNVRFKLQTCNDKRLLRKIR